MCNVLNEIKRDGIKDLMTTHTYTQTFNNYTNEIELNRQKRYHRQIETQKIHSVE